MENQDRSEKQENIETIFKSARFTNTTQLSAMSSIPSLDISSSVMNTPIVLSQSTGITNQASISQPTNLVTFTSISTPNLLAAFTSLYPSKSRKEVTKERIRVIKVQLETLRERRRVVDKERNEMSEEARALEEWIEEMPGGLERIRQSVELVELAVKGELGNLQ
ncbi:hypothetical protein EAF00_012019 [Botryotinia globosa]|nr:hypothetical protein EAF00_012019 [Botryotinia globosa]